jgi:antitoxin HicB
MSKPSDYPVTLHVLSAADGGGFLVVVEDLPGCIADGATPDQAYANALDAIACWIEAAEELGRAVPEPKPWRAGDLRKYG